MFCGNCKMFTIMHHRGKSSIKPIRMQNIQKGEIAKKLIWPIKILLKLLLFDLEATPIWWKCVKWIFFHGPLLAFQLLVIGHTIYIIHLNYLQLPGNCVSWGMSLIVLHIENVFAHLWLLKYEFQSGRLLQEFVNHITLRATTCTEQKLLSKLICKLRIIVVVAIAIWVIMASISLGISIQTMIYLNVSKWELFVAVILRGEHTYFYLTIITGVGMFTTCIKMATTTLISYTCAVVQHKLEEAETIVVKYKTELKNLPEDFRNRRITMDVIVNKTHKCHREGCCFVLKYDALISFHLFFAFTCDVVSLILIFRMMQDFNYTITTACRLCISVFIIAAFLAKYWFTSSVNMKVNETLTNIPGADLTVENHPDNNHSTETQANLQLYCALMTMNPPNLTAWKFFSITRGFLLDVVGTAVTYTIFLYQSLRM